ncbi:MAG: glycosyltransferase family 2 protein [Elainellaceae cyanobacterium]
MRLAVVIVNYRTPNLVIDCLKSLEFEVDPNQDRVVVVDNASGDNSVSLIDQFIQQNCWQSWVKLIPSPVNGGFSAGNNLGIKAVEADAYLLTNSDTIIRKGAIQELLSVMERHPEVGLLSPRLEWPDGTPQNSCFRYRSPISEFIEAARTSPISKLLRRYEVPIEATDVPTRPEWTSFACVLIRKAVIEQIGLMDEGYFMYFDDIDYCRRSRNAGWDILNWPQARVVHLRGGSSPVKSEVAARKRPRAYLYASRSRYFTTFYGPFGLWMANAGWLAGRAVSLLRELVGHKLPHTCELEAVDIWTNWRSPLKAPLQPER